LAWRKQRSKNHAIKKASERAEARPEAVVDARAAGVVRMATAVVHMVTGAEAIEAAAETGAGSKVRPRSISRS
jgi:hypothetical protein